MYYIQCRSDGHIPDGHILDFNRFNIMILKTWINVLWYRFVYRVKKLRDFIKLGWNDEDFDYVFILYIEKYKLKKLLEEYEKHKGYRFFSDNMEWSIRNIRICKNLIDIITGKDTSYKITAPGYKKNILKYVNVGNAHRFMSESMYKELKSLSKSNGFLHESISDEIRRCKAWSLYCQIRKDNFMTWWL